MRWRSNPLCPTIVSPPSELRPEVGAALRLAKEASRQATVRLRRLQRHHHVAIDSVTAHDVKLAADRESEQIILRVLRRDSDYSVLSEERGWTGDRGPQPSWIVDPLDGSHNYLRSIPMCCVSIALWDGDTPVLGVIQEIHSGEVFSGIVGTGAWIGVDQELVVSAVASMSDAVICTGFPAGTDFGEAAITTFVKQVTSYRKVRLLGSAALSLAYVAAGRADAYYERDIKLWDIAAGVALVRAAGGVVTSTAVDSVTYGMTVNASNGRLPRVEV